MTSRNAGHAGTGKALYQSNTVVKTEQMGIALTAQKPKLNAFANYLQVQQQKSMYGLLHMYTSSQRFCCYKVGLVALGFRLQRTLVLTDNQHKTYGPCMWRPHMHPML